jgi:putative SOS response-associated peptidase YedK
MCYSAMIVEQWRNYVKITGAEMDIRQFAELIGFRAQGQPIRIARAVDRWFAQPQTADERQIKGMIDAYRAGMVSKLEKEIFSQRKRVADAERALQEKPTKKAAEDVRIGTSKLEKALRDLPLYKSDEPTKLDGRIFPMTYAPIVINEGGRNVVRLARYHCRQPGKPASIDRQFPGLYNARRDNIEKFWRKEFGQTHALMLVESFYENVDRDGKNAVLHFVPRPQETMLVACVYAQWTDPKTGEKLLSFAAITDEPPAEVAAAGHDRMIINIRPENVQRWLTPQGRSTEDLQEILSDRQTPYYEHELLAA